MISWPGRTLVLSFFVIALVTLIAALAIHAFRGFFSGNAAADAELARRGRSFLLGDTIRQGFAWWIGPFERWLAAGSVSPDTLTVAGCVACCSGALLVGAGDLTVGGFVVLASSAFDFVDGRIARRRGIANRGGEFLDSTADRYADAFCFGAAAFLLRENAWHLSAALLAFGATLIVSYTRAKAEALGVPLRGGLMQRAERVVLYSAAAIFGAVLDPMWHGVVSTQYPTFVAMVWFLALATTGTAISRTRDGLLRVREANPTDD